MIQAALQGAEFLPTAVIPGGTTWDPAFNGISATYSGGNLVATVNSLTGSSSNVRSTTTRASGKFYTETTLTASTLGEGVFIGVGTSAQTYFQYLGFAVSSFAIYQDASGVMHAIGGGTNVTFGGGVTFTTGDIIGMAINIGHTITFYKNGISLGTFPFALPNATYYMMAGTNYNVPATTLTENFGNSAFASITAPIRSALANQGYVAWDGQNLNPGAVFATWDPAKTGTGVVLSGGNLIATLPNSAVGSSLSTVSKSSGKWWFEETIDNTIPTTFPNFGMGIGLIGVNVNANIVGDPNAWSYVAFAGSSYVYHSSFVTFGSYPATGDKIGIALDMDNGTIDFYRNGVLMTPSHAFSGLSGAFFASIGSILGNQYTITANFGATPISGVGGTGFPPDGYHTGLY